MTQRGVKEALERRKGIGEDERQLVMAGLASQWRHSNLVTLNPLMTFDMPMYHKYFSILWLISCNILKPKVPKYFLNVRSLLKKKIWKL